MCGPASAFQRPLVMSWISGAAMVWGHFVLRSQVISRKLDLKWGKQSTYVAGA